ncbi:hypothetical protein DPMN_141478 [Dreissena polymorpha]|uniref:EGF-like domain-containing protein n=1 Tax=Dreissena polymorpha TaxID=45954 RepID=A0A9D4GDJ3_DREPO|nr:hypothetical protein DPMN_141478 [Dreissena polymorpha]
MYSEIYFKHCFVTDIDECQVFSPCKNGATCINRMGDYRCLCPKGWTGANCSIGKLVDNGYTANCSIGKLVENGYTANCSIDKLVDNCYTAICSICKLVDNGYIANC